jgi:hypothetical protein
MAGVPIGEPLRVQHVSVGDISEPLDKFTEAVEVYARVREPFEVDIAIFDDNQKEARLWIPLPPRTPVVRIVPRGSRYRIATRMADQ